MKLRVLVENCSIDKNLGFEHGLSIYIECNGRKILFDTGASDLFYENAKKLGVKLQDVDTFVLSHGHNDHGGGLGKFLDINKKAKVFIGQDAFIKRENPLGAFRGLDESLKDNERITFINGDLSLGNGIYLFSASTMDTEVPVDIYYSYENGVRVNDTFKDELYLVLPNNNGNTLLCGCAHKGIDNILAFVSKKLESKGLSPITVVVGGLHTKGLIGVENSYFYKVKELINNTNIKYLLGHCTGEQEVEDLLDSYKDKVQKIYTGFDICL